MRKMTLKDVEDGICLAHEKPDYLRDFWMVNNDTGFYIPLLCFHLEDDNPVLLEVIGESERTCLFQAWVRGISYEKNDELIPDFVSLEFLADEENGYIDMDIDVEREILKAIINQCPKACGHSIEELLTDCRRSECDKR